MIPIPKSIASDETLAWVNKIQKQIYPHTN